MQPTSILLRMTKKSAARRFALLLMAAFAASLASTPIHAAPPPQVAFYMQGLKQAFDHRAAMIYLLDLCMRRFTLECRLTGESYAIVKKEVAELDQVRLFAIAHTYKEEQFETAAEIEAASLSEHRAFLQSVLEFELELTSRYAATAEVCPTERQLRRTAATAALNLRLFWGLSEDETLDVMDEYGRRLTQYAAQIRPKGADQYCEPLRRHGSLLIAILRDRIEPYVANRTVAPDSARLQLVVGSLWWMLAAMELEAGNERFKHLQKE